MRARALSRSFSRRGVDDLGLRRDDFAENSEAPRENIPGALMYTTTGCVGVRVIARAREAGIERIGVVCFSRRAALWGRKKKKKKKKLIICRSCFRRVR